MIPPIIAAKGAQNASNAVTKPLTGDIYVRRWTTTAKKGKRKGQAIEHEVRVNAVTALAAGVAVGVTALLGGAALWMTQQKIGKTGNLKQVVRRVRSYDATVEAVKVIDSPEYTETKTIVNWHEEVGHYETVANATATCPVDGSTINATGERVRNPQTGAWEYSTQAFDRWETLHAQHWPSMEWTYSDGQVWVVDKAAGYYPSFMTIHHDEVSHMEDRVTKQGRTIVMTPRGVPIKQFSDLGRLPTDREILGTNAADYTRFKEPWPVREGNDRLGHYAEYDARYQHTTKQTLGLTDRGGFLEG